MCCDLVLLVFYKAQAGDRPQIPALSCRFQKLFFPKLCCPWQACCSAFEAPEACCFLLLAILSSPWSECLRSHPRWIFQSFEFFGLQENHSELAHPYLVWSSSLYFLLSSYRNVNHRLQLLYKPQAHFILSLRVLWPREVMTLQVTWRVKGPCLTPSPVLFLLNQAAFRSQRKSCSKTGSV